MSDPMTNDRTGLVEKVADAIYSDLCNIGSATHKDAEIIARAAIAAMPLKSLHMALLEAINLHEIERFPFGDPPYYGAKDYVYSVEQAAARSRLFQWRKALADTALSEQSKGE